MDETAVQDPVAPTPPPPPPRRLLRREGGEDKVGGVCAGVADYLSVDVTLVRIAAVFLAFAGPGFPAYVVAWIVMPVAPVGTPPSPVRYGPVLDGGSTPIAAIALLFAAAFVVFDGGPFGQDVLWPVLLIGAGVWLLVRDRGAAPGPPVAPGQPPPRMPSPGHGTSPSGPAGGWQQQLGTAPTGRLDPVPGRVALGPRSRVGQILLGLLALGGALLWVLVATDAVALSLADGLALTLVGMGLGMVVGAWAGGARWLIAPALGVVALLTLTRAVDVPLEGGFGERRHTPGAIEDVVSAYRLTAGEMVLDLRDLDLRGKRLDVVASIGAGSLLVRVPGDVEVEVASRIAAGELRTPASATGRGGLGIDEDLVVEGREGAGTLVLDLEVGIGEVEVTRG